MNGQARGEARDETRAEDGAGPDITGDAVHVSPLTSRHQLNPWFMVAELI